MVNYDSLKEHIQQMMKMISISAYLADNTDHSAGYPHRFDRLSNLLLL